MKRARISSLEYCRDLVSRFDHDSYISSLYSRNKEAVWAIRAFNIEIASIQDIVTQNHIGKIRFQWWRDSIAKVFQGNPPVHPVCLALARVLESSSLDIDNFIKIIDARDKMLAIEQFPTLFSIESYSEESQSTILHLCLKASGIDDQVAYNAASHAGKCIGLVICLKSVPFLLQKRKLMLPSELTAKYNVSTEQVLRGNLAGLDDVVFDVATRANDQALTCQTFDIQKEAKLNLLPIVPAKMFLERLEKVQFDILHQSLQKRSLMLYYNLWKSSRGTGKLVL